MPVSESCGTAILRSRGEPRCTDIEVCEGLGYAPTFVDRMNLCEKLGVISSAADLIEIRDLRNQIAHEYLSDNLTEIYGDCLTLSEKLRTEIQVAHPIIERYLKSD